MSRHPNEIHYKHYTLHVMLTCALLLVFVVITLFPFFWLFTASIKLDRDIITKTLHILPPEVTFKHYHTVFTFGKIGRIFLNTSFVALVTVLVSLVAIIPAAFALSVLQVKGKEYISKFILALQMLPSILLIIPLYIMLQRVRLIDTYWALVLSYTTFTIPFCFLLLSSYFRGLPFELFESAYLDGASSWYSMIKIAIPLTTPGIMTTGTYSFLMAWNDFLYANTFTSSTETRTLTVEVIRLVGTWGNRWGDLAAGATVTVFPVIVIFLFANKYIISGLTAGAVKG